MSTIDCRLPAARRLRKACLPLQLAAAVLAVSAALVPVCAAAPVVPSFEQVRAAHRASDWRITDRHGVTLQRLRHDDTVRRLGWVRLEHVSPSLQATLLAAEDRRFYSHGGVDWAAVAQAAWDNARARVRPASAGPVVRGASTLSMQLAALLDPGLRPAVKQRRDLQQKWNQAQAAWEIERHWSKAQIFEAYLNLLPLRGETVGIAAASEFWFGKAADGLELAEAALLAALIRQPQAATVKVGERACGIVAALDANVLPILPRPTCPDLKLLALDRLSRQAGVRLGPRLASHAARLAHGEWKAGGLPNPGRSEAGEPLLATTLDAGLQVFVKERLDQHLRELSGRNVEDGAVVVLDNATGEVLAWVGSSGSLSDAAEVDGVTALRQAGSTLKPFLYGLALDQRLLTAASLVEDSPVALTAENGVYVPQNYDRSYRGMVSVRTALASSLNIPAVRTLLMTGTDRFFESLRAFGFSSLTHVADYYGLALALGSAEVRLLDLANAYRALANGGRWSSVAPLLHPDGAARGAAIRERRVLGAGAAFIIGDILSDRGARAPSFGLENPLSTRVWSAVKTGTSKDMRDNWAVGFTGRHTVAVWVGNFSGASMWNVSGVHGAAPLWRDIVHFLHESAPSYPPAAPASLEAVEVSFEDIGEATRREWFFAGTAMPVVKRSGRATAALPTAMSGTPRIVYPADGLIVAIDPDIPAEFERIPLRMRPALSGYGWRLERGGAPGCRVVPVGDNWAPNPGQWKLSLIDAAGKAVDSVHFSVRGMPKHPVSCPAEGISEASAGSIGSYPLGRQRTIPISVTAHE